MKKLLYITASTKPEEMSTSKTVGREFVDRFIEQYSDYQLIELDIYNEYIPEMNYKYFKCRAELVSGQEYEALSQDDKLAVDKINELCDQFLSADVYVIAVPMWSVMFPAKLKTYIDCIILNNKVISVTPDKVKGLLDDKERKMVYIQSSGGVYPKIFSGKINHGVNYIHDTFKFLGINRFDKIMVEGVDMPSIGRQAAIEKAVEEMDDIISNMQ